MAGGGGTRLWPLSRRSIPKQMLNLFGERTLFQTAVDRLLPLIPIDQIYVVTIAEQALQLQDQAPEIPVSNYLIEPGPKGTASVVGLAAAVLQKADPLSRMACLTADHYIGNETMFRELLTAANSLATADELVTLGITPTYPSTGYGYIHQGAELGNQGGFPAFRVQKFNEKPVLSVARDFLLQGGYSWNSGMFVWKTGAILNEIERQMPDLSAGLAQITGAWGTNLQEEVVEQVWGGLVSETIDYGIMENAARVSMLQADGLEWWDVGGWDRLFELLPLDPDGNLIVGKQPVLFDTHNTMIYQTSSQGDERMIAALGVDNLVIVDTGDVLMICPRERAEEVREVVKLLRTRKQERYL
jgi:mannose-1-phosphate guanylyltransferase